MLLINNLQLIVQACPGILGFVFLRMAIIALAALPPGFSHCGGQRGRGGGDDIEAHGDGAGAIEEVRGHEGTVLRKCVREGATATPAGL
jgi:hypothetical protein